MSEPPGAELSIRPAGRLRRNFALLGGLLATLCASVLLFWQQVTTDTPSALFVLGLVGAMMSAVGLVYTLRANPMRRVTWGQLVLDGVGLRLGGELLALRSEIVRGFHVRASETIAPPAGAAVEPASTPPACAEVQIERRWPRRAVELIVTDEQVARAVLRYLGLDASQTVATFKLASLLHGRASTGLLTWLIAGAALFVPMFSVALPPEVRWLTIAVTWTALAAWIVGLSIPSRIVVGTDGVLVSWLFRNRFVPYERVRGVRPIFGARRGLCLVLDGSGALNLPVRRAITTDVEQRDAAVVIERVSQALHEHRAGMIGGVGQGGLPERGGREAAEWVRTLRRAGAGGSDDHRTPAIRKDVLWRVVEDPAAAAGDRATAAVALSAALGAEDKLRIRIAAEATAAPEIRAVLEAVAAEADEAELARTVRRLG